MVVAIALGGVLALANCSKSPSVAISTATSTTTNDRITTGYSPSAIAYDKALTADSRGEYAAAIHFRHLAWSTRRISRGDDLFRSQLEVANAVDDIALGNYIKARSELRLGVQPYFFNVGTRMPILARGLQQPRIENYRDELKLIGAIDKNHPSCIDNSISALETASRNHFARAKHLLIVGLIHEGCFQEQRQVYLPYLAAVALSLKERDAALLWLYRCLIFPVHVGDIEGISVSSTVAASILQYAADGDLEVVRAYIIS